MDDDVGVDDVGGADNVVKVLCLHGYASNGQTFLNAKAKDLAKHLASNAAASIQLTPADGPSKLEGGRGAQRAWWTFDPEFPLTDRTKQPAFWARAEVAYCGAVEAIDALVEAWCQDEELQGIMGFSQGALMAAMLTARLQMLGRRSPAFVLLFNGFVRPLPSNLELSWWRDPVAGRPGLINAPTLIFSGELDQATPLEQQQQLALRFANARRHVVKGGAHAMPRNADDLVVVSQFIRGQGRRATADGLLSSTPTQSTPTCEECESGESRGGGEDVPDTTNASSMAKNAMGIDPALRVCKYWARGRECTQRGCPFRHALLGDREVRRAERARLQRAEAIQLECGDEAEWSAHASGRTTREAHAGRHAVFAEWLVETFGVEALQHGHGVLDVAGGRAGLSFELLRRYQIASTLLEPTERTVLLKSHQRKFLRKHPQLQPIQHVTARLDSTLESSAEGVALLAGCSILVGMHADEATEPIVRAAARYAKPFAVVPCCFFPWSNSDRQLANGKMVGSNFDAFCQWLMELVPGCERARLPFEGRNCVIFRRSAFPVLRSLRDTTAPSRRLRVVASVKRTGAGAVAFQLRPASLPNLVYLFGPPACGKNHVGELLQTRLGYLFLDADDWLPEDLSSALRAGHGFTDEQRDRYYSHIQKCILVAQEQSKGRPLAIAQATLKNRHRLSLLASLPGIQLWWICASEEARRERLSMGGNRVGVELGLQMAEGFEAPTHDHAVVYNDGDDGQLIQQVHALIP